MAVAGWAGCADLKKALRSNHLPPALARGTGLGFIAGTRAGTVAGQAGLQPMKGDLFFCPVEGIFQGQFQVVPQAFSLPGSGPSPPVAKTEKALKDISKT